MLVRKLYSIGAIACALTIGAVPAQVQADETCMSPYMAKIVGQEDYVYIWTLGVEGLGDGQDKLVTIDVNPNSDKYGEVIQSLSVGGRNEAHHSGLTDDRKYLWAGGLDTNKIFIFDVSTNPAAPTLHKVVTDFVSASGGVVGPHTTYAMPGRMLVTGLSNNSDNGGRTGMVEYTNEGEYLATHWMPTDDDLRGAEKSGKFADGYGYDLRVLPRRNVMITSSFTGWSAAGWRSDETLWQYCSGVGSAQPQAQKSVRRARHTARDSLCMATDQQLVCHNHCVDQQDLADI